MYIVKYTEELRCTTTMFTVIFLALALPVLVLSQNVTITTTDPRMHFEGTWFDQDSGGHETTATLGSSVSLIFPG